MDLTIVKNKGFVVTLIIINSVINLKHVISFNKKNIQNS